MSEKNNVAVYREEKLQEMVLLSGETWYQLKIVCENGEFKEAVISNRGQSEKYFRMDKRQFDELCGLIDEARNG